MNRNIKKIIKNLEEVKDKSSKAKNTLTNWAKDLGFQEELVDAGIALWKDLDKANISKSLGDTGVAMSENLVQSTEDYYEKLFGKKIEESIQVAGTVSIAFSGVAASGVSLSYPLEAYPQSYSHLTKLLDQSDRNSLIKEKLEKIDKSLAVEYENAWKQLYSLQDDKTRTPMFLIREVFNRLLYYFAPDLEVLTDNNLTDKADITRSMRISYIASRIIDPLKKQSFIQQNKSLNDIYSLLSKAHKHGTLDDRETKGYLYQANALIELLLN